MSASIASTAGPTYEVRAMSLAEILDTSFQLVKNAFLLLGGLAAIVYLPLSILLGAMAFGLDLEAMEAEQLEAMTPVLLAGFGVYAIAMFIGFPFVVGAVTGVAGRLFLGHTVAMRDAVRLGLGRFLPLLWTYFLVSLLMAVVMLAAVLLVVGVSLLLGEAGRFSVALAAGVFIVAFGVALFYVGAALVLVPQVVVLEELSGSRAISRSWELSQGTRLRILGVMLTAGLLVFIPISGLQMMMNIVPIVGAVVWGIAQALGFAFTSAAQVVLYFDIRCRREAFDLEHLARLVEGQGAAPRVDPI